MEVPLKQLPEEVEVIETDFDERQEQLREIDRQRKIDDPTYQGAFHQKKKKTASKRSYTDRFNRTKPRQKKKRSRR
jgi:ATP-dependent RNA helicase RhlE